MYELTHKARIVEGGIQLTTLASLGAPQERQWLDILAKAFGSPEFPSYVEDFPIWAGPRNDTVRLVAVRANTVVATVGLRFAELKPERTPVALIGAVATREDVRGQGLAGLLLDEAVSLVDRAGVKTTCLWGEPLTLYQRRGFEPVGEQKIFTLAGLGLGAGNAPASIAGRISREFSPLLLPLMQKRPAGLVRTFADADLLVRHKNTHWMYLTEPLGTPAAFIAWGRGVDLPGIVHEWGGTAEGVHALLGDALKQIPGLMIVGRNEEFKDLGIFESTAIHSMPVALVRGVVPNNLWIWGLDGV